MDHNSRRYFEAQVLTATPQKLRLLLIDGAIRYAHQTLNLWDEDRFEEAVETCIQCRSVISELLSGVRIDGSDLTQKVVAIYMFLFRTLTEAQLKRDRNKMLEAIRVLESERETWRLVCEQMPDAPVPPPSSTFGPPVEIVAPSTGIGGPPVSSYSFDA